MISDDERREVAERLRELEKGVIGAFIPTRELAENVLRAIDYGRSGAMTPYGCLADLIDPACEAYRDSIFYPATGLTPEHEETVYRCGRCDEVVSDDEGYDPETDLPAYCERCGSRIIGIGELWDE